MASDSNVTTCRNSYILVISIYIILQLPITKSQEVVQYKINVSKPQVLGYHNHNYYIHPLLYTHITVQ